MIRLLTYINGNEIFWKISDGRKSGNTEIVHIAALVNIFAVSLLAFLQVYLQLELVELLRIEY